jgi:hypothetical protein
LETSPESEVKGGRNHPLLMKYLRYVHRRLICPSCGSEERKRFEFSQMIVESPCARCEVMIRWKRKYDLNGRGTRTAFDDYEAEIAAKRLINDLTVINGLRTLLVN